MLLLSGDALGLTGDALERWALLHYTLCLKLAPCRWFDPCRYHVWKAARQLLQHLWQQLQGQTCHGHLCQGLRALVGAVCLHGLLPFLEHYCQLNLYQSSQRHQLPSDHLKEDRA